MTLVLAHLHDELFPAAARPGHLLNLGLDSCSHAVKLLGQLSQSGRERPDLFSFHVDNGHKFPPRSASFCFYYIGKPIGQL